VPPLPPKVFNPVPPARKTASGKTPAGKSVSATVPGTAGGSKGVQIKGDPGSPCLISYPSASVPLVGTVGGGCILSKTNMRAMVGGLVLGAGGIVALGGLAVLAAAGFKRSGALDKVAGGVGSVPGGQAAAAGLRSAGRARASRRASAAKTERAQMRQLGEPRENPNLRTGRGAVAETPAGTRRRKTERTGPVEPASREETGF
jgi:hypothetical protein